MPDDPFVVLKLVYRVDGTYIVFEEVPTAHIRENLLKVFDFYRVPHKQEQDGTILVPREIAEDVEMVYNYVIKADDPHWMRSH